VGGKTLCNRAFNPERESDDFVLQRTGVRARTAIAYELPYQVRHLFSTIDRAGQALISNLDFLFS
jgi:hypothetical protein